MQLETGADLRVDSTECHQHFIFYFYYYCPKICIFILGNESIFKNAGTICHVNFRDLYLGRSSLSYFFLFIMEFDFRDLVIIIYLFCTLDPKRFFLLRCQHEIWERVGTQAARPIFLSLILTVDAIIGKPLVMPEQIYSL